MGSSARQGEGRGLDPCTSIHPCMHRRMRIHLCAHPHGQPLSTPLCTLTHIYTLPDGLWQEPPGRKSRVRVEELFAHSCGHGLGLKRLCPQSSKVSAPPSTRPSTQDSLTALPRRKGVLWVGSSPDRLVECPTAHAVPYCRRPLHPHNGAPRAAAYCGLSTGHTWGGTMLKA